MMGRAATNWEDISEADMKRREFIKLVGGASAIPAFSVARSQEPGRTRRIGILSDSLNDRWQTGWRAFFEELAAGGFIEGTNLQVDRRGFNRTTLDTVAAEPITPSRAGGLKGNRQGRL